MISFIDTALLSETAAPSQALTLMSSSILLASTRTGMLGQNWRSSSYHLQVVLPSPLRGQHWLGRDCRWRPITTVLLLAGRCCWWVLIQDAGAAHSKQ